MSTTETATVVDRETWLEAQRTHLITEKALTQERERVAALRRDLPWTEVDANYRFDTGAGEVTLLDLFEGRGQLAMYHFMYGPDWEEGCPSCSFWADNYNGTDGHLAARDTSFVVASRASVEQLHAYRDRMGWDFRWVSSGDSDFNYDVGVSTRPDDLGSGALEYNFATSPSMGEESPGLSLFARDGDRVFLTFQVFARGLDLFNGTYHVLDFTAKGRDEGSLPFTMAWLRRNDQYDE